MAVSSLSGYSAAALSDDSARAVAVEAFKQIGAYTGGRLLGIGQGALGEVSSATKNVIDGSIAFAESRLSSELERLAQSPCL